MKRLWLPLGAALVLLAGCKRPPAVPVLTCSHNGTAGVAFEVKVSAVEPDQEDVSYLLDWGDGAAEDWSIPYPSGQELPFTHVYEQRDTYELRARARDIQGSESDWSPPCTLAMPYSAPDSPVVVAGPDTARIGHPCEFLLRLTDPDGDSISVRLDWGDSTLSGWSPAAASGSTVRLSHVYLDSGKVEVRAQTRDSRDARGPWQIIRELRVRDPWVTVVHEDFEHSFPAANWLLLGTGQNSSTWGVDKHRPHAGKYSCWCAGSSGKAPGPYPANVEAWMVYGPFSLEGAVDAQMALWRWAMTEEGFDGVFWGVSVNGSDFSGYYLTGTWPYWECDTVDFKNVPGLGNVCGSTQVWVAFIFSSDATNQNEGCYVDDVLLRKIMGGAADRRPLARDPDSQPARPELKPAFRSLERNER
jgi:hypothetical protein